MKPLKAVPPARLQLPEAARVRHLDARIEAVRLVRVVQQHYILAKVHQSGAGMRHLLLQPLRAVLSRLDRHDTRLALEAATKAVSMRHSVFLEVLGRYISSQLAKGVLEECPCHIWLTQPIDVPDAVRLQLITTDGDGWPEVAQQPRGAVTRNFPDAEESQHMINSVGVKILGHVGQSPLPERITVLLHFVPLVCGEAPVLPHFGKHVWRCACRYVHAEVARMHPCIHTALVHSNREVALQDDTV
mmetsp:Transcript_13105/g.39670  ORF Transcript_13105/g.39670 Transcript_13105/m.39670 type:complete len:245 (+) Transcript_13105:2656-3390(+)